MKKLTKYPIFHNHKLPLSTSIDKNAWTLIKDFNEQIQNGMIQFEFVSCLCGKQQFELLASIDRFKFFQKTVICTNCGLISANPRMTDNEYSKFYGTSFYIDVYAPQINKEELNYDQYTIHEIIKPHLDQINSIVEVGCNRGYLLYPYFLANKKVIGYDLSKDCVEIGKKKGLDLRVGSISEIKEKFDLIILSHIIEHFTHPLNEIKKILDHLNENGLVYIEVPNIEYFGINMLENAHTYYFTRDTLMYYMGICGLVVVSETENFTNKGINGANFGILFTKKQQSNEAPFLLESEYNKMKTIILKEDFKMKYKYPFKRFKLLIKKTLSLLSLKNSTRVYK